MPGEKISLFGLGGRRGGGPVLQEEHDAGRDGSTGEFRERDADGLKSVVCASCDGTYCGMASLEEPTERVWGTRWDEVEAGQFAGFLHEPATPALAPVPVRFEVAGLVICKRVPGRTERGDCLFHLGVDLDGQPAS